jgi:hypothetical protein
VRRLYVPITAGEFEQLRSIALQERRRPQDQAAIIIAERLERSTMEVDRPHPTGAEQAERPPEATR